MKVSYKWLSEYVDVKGHTAEQLAELLTRSGIEVDGVESSNKGVTEQVVVGYVQEKHKHPDADKLSVCKVDVGDGELLQIVCGAKNVDAGQKVPVALVGAKLPGGLKIKRAKLRGVESRGMICSAKELGLSEKLLPKEAQEGIMVLPEEATVGQTIIELLGLDDAVLELDLTPNRSDCLSMIGVAYEVAAILGTEVKLPEHQSVSEQAGLKAEDHIRVNISASKECSHYAARYIEGVQLGPSPWWLKSRLMAAGVRPINNVVDITNYVMLEYGQPLHAFDASKLYEGRIDVRLAQEGEQLVTLDDEERKLEPGMLLVTDSTKPVAIAGVMGGANSEVTNETKAILLESAHFSGSSVRITSRKLGLRSEASLRFEKEANPEGVIPALNRAAALIAQLAHGQVAEGIVQQQVGTPQKVQIELKVARVNDFLGTDITGEEIKAILRKLQFEYEENGETLLVTIPLRRGDIFRDVDLIEEIARLYGYDRIPTTPVKGDLTSGSLTKEQRVRRAIRHVMTSSGFHEVITYAFTHPKQIAQFPGLYPEAKPIPLAMPMSEERSVLRTSLVPHLLETAIYNRHRNEASVAIFEQSNIFITDEEVLQQQPQEIPMLAMLWTGKRQPDHWNTTSESVDFYDLKGVADHLFRYLGIEGVIYQAASIRGMHPGRTAELYLEDEQGAKRIGVIGQVHPELQQTYDLEDTYVLEIELEGIYQACQFDISYTPSPKYPAISRDIALVVDRHVPVAELERMIVSSAGDLLESVQLFDVYMGEKLGADKKSVALTLVYRHPDRTLTDDEVNQAQDDVISALNQQFDAQLRK